MLIALAIYYRWNIYQLNIITVFLNANINVKVYMKILENIKNNIKDFLILKNINSNSNYSQIIALRLCKTLYNLK